MGLQASLLKKSKLSSKKLATVFFEDYCTPQQMAETTRSEAHPIALEDIPLWKHAKSVHHGKATCNPTGCFSGNAVTLALSSESEDDGRDMQERIKVKVKGKAIPVTVS
jgi:hypothetical protein